MPNYGLSLNVIESENVGIITPSMGRTWALRLACSSCRDVTENFIFVSSTLSCETSGGGSANFCLKCKTCKQQMTVNVVKEGPTTLSNSFGEDVAVFDIRNAEPVALLFQAGWEVTTSSGEGAEKFLDVLLDEEWTDYDERSQQPISILKVKAVFHRT